MNQMLGGLKAKIAWEDTMLQKLFFKMQNKAHFIFVWLQNNLNSDKASWKDEVKKHMGISTSESNKLQTYL